MPLPVIVVSAIAGAVAGIVSSRNWDSIKIQVKRGKDKLTKKIKPQKKIGKQK